VLALFGQCFVETAGRRNALRPGDAVHVGDILDVAPAAKLKLRMSDGSVIAVASGSRLTIVDYRLGNGGESRDATLSLGQGLLRALVSVLRGEPHFEVDTATGVAAVRSTDWFIEARPGSTQVGVLAGRVSLKSVATGREIVIPAAGVRELKPAEIRSRHECGPRPNSPISSAAPIWNKRSRRDVAARRALGRCGAGQRRPRGAGVHCLGR
jgi:hypothetical protein